MVQALREFNNTLPAYKPVVRYDQLVASAQSRIDERAAQLEAEELDRLYAEAIAAETEKA